MNEDELKSALHDAMVASSPPPPMSPEAAVAAGQAARRRRKTAWGGAVAGLAVVAITVGAVLVPQLAGGSGEGAVIEAGGRSSDPRPVPPGWSGVTATTPPSPTGSPAQTAPSTASGPTERRWPDGQTDRTATSGPRAEKSVRVLNELGSSLPPTFQAVDKQASGGGWSGPMRYTQSQFATYYGRDEQSWEYLATTPVVRDGSPGVGRLWIQVATKGNRMSSTTSPCQASDAAWSIKGTCEVVDVGGKEVGYLTAARGEESDLDELAIYRHDDGTVVYLGQSAAYRNTGHPALSGQVFTREQLAALVIDEKFHLG
ncbi:hypothetical protein [Actinosynnema sp. NPDC023587]|uniref:hypothetical protein n=1 Tax=Actinosynnema sp. NPDC023587 TaxID=3154695 RepID=UPI0033E16786